MPYRNLLKRTCPLHFLLRFWAACRMLGWCATPPDIRTIPSSTAHSSTSSGSPTRRPSLRIVGISRPFRWVTSHNSKTPSPRVADPDWFNADPDPAFFLIADPDPGLFCEFLQISVCCAILEAKNWIQWEVLKKSVHCIKLFRITSNCIIPVYSLFYHLQSPEIERKKYKIHTIFL